jgi:hypothetical protein
VAGKDKMAPRGVHFVCRLGRCGFYMQYVGRDGEPVTVDDDDDLAVFVKLRIL